MQAMVRHRHRVQFHFSFWVSAGNGFFTCERTDLEAAIRESGFADTEIRRRMGHGYELLGKAFEGMRLTQYEVQHVEWGILTYSSADRLGNPMEGLHDLEEKQS